MNLKAFGRNAFSYLIGNACVRTAGLLLIPLYTHSLSLADYGVLSTLLITVQLMTLVMGMATDKGFLRFARECEERNLLGKLLGTTVMLNCVGACVVTGFCMALLLPVLGNILHTAETVHYAILACLSAFFQALFDRTAVYYRARNQGFRFLIANVPVLLLLLTATFVFLRILGRGIEGALLAQIAAYGTVWVCIFPVLMARAGFGVSVELTKRLLRFSLPLLSGLVSAIVVDISAIYMLGYFAGPEQVGIYSLGYKIAQIAAMAVILPFQLAYEPFAYANVGDPLIKGIISKLLTYLMLTYAVVAFGIAFITRPLLAMLAPPEYYPAYRVVFLMLPGIAFMGVYYVAETLLGMGHRTGFLGWAGGFFSLLAIFLYFALVPHWGIYGVVASLTFVRVMAALVCLAAGRRVFSVPVDVPRLSIIGVGFGLLLLLVFALFKTAPYVYYSLIPAGAFAMVFFLYLCGFVDTAEKAFVKELFQNASLRLSGRQLGAN